MTVLERDLDAVQRQLGRPPRDVIAVAARCICGAPTVVTTRPRLADGTPFPTFYYLTHPAATAAASRLEATGRMAAYQAELVGETADAYRAAHGAYLADREAVEAVPEIAGYSAGGMPERVKCLHALVAHALARPGVNPIGERALADLAAVPPAEGGWSPEVCACAL